MINFKNINVRSFLELIGRDMTPTSELVLANFQDEI